MLNQSSRKTLGCGESTKVEKEYMRMEKILRLPLKNLKNLVCTLKEPQTMTLFLR